MKALLAIALRAIFAESLAEVGELLRSLDNTNRKKTKR